MLVCERVSVLACREFVYLFFVCQINQVVCVCLFDCLCVGLVCLFVCVLVRLFGCLFVCLFV